MRFDTADEEFRQEAIAWLQSLTDETIADLRAVFRLSPGYYPTTLLELWRIEVSHRGLTHAAVSHLEGSDRALLPVCHPGDCEWRFTAEAAVALLDQATNDLPSGTVVAHLGTPTTFLLGRERHTSLKHVLFERSESIVDALRTTEHVYKINLGTDEPPALEAGAAILDPPWYPADTYAFLAATSRVCARGACIVLCQPTLATRPSVAEERAALLDELPRLGFICRNVAATHVRYHMPHFETSSLKVAAPDIFIPDDWRVGDVVILEKVDDSPSLLMHPLPIESWDETNFGPVRIKLRRTEAPNLGSLVPGDVLGTVSRRDPIRTRIGLWTSGNRVFSLEDHAAIGTLIQLCHNDVMQSQFTLRRTLLHARTIGISRRTAQQLFSLLLIELQEHALGKRTKGIHE